MKRILMVLGVICSLLMLSGAVSAVEYKWDGSRFIQVTDEQPIPVDAGSLTLVADPCPGGVCPVNRRQVVSSTQTVKSTHVETYSSSRSGPLRQIAENIRQRRQERQANRQARSGGCSCR